MTGFEEIFENNDDGQAILPDMLKGVGVSLTLVTLGIPPWHPCWLNPFDEP